MCQVWSWEPATCHQNVRVPWGRVGDTAIVNGELYAACFNKGTLAVWGLDLEVGAGFRV